jgi:putative flippase GtrA
MTALRQVASLYLSEQFGRFLIAGGVALLANWLSRFVFGWYVGFGWSIVLAYLVGIVVAFTLNKIFVFPHGDRSLNSELFLFFLINIGAFPVVWIAAYILGDWIFVRWIPERLALALGHGIAITFPALINFVLHKFVTFREARDATQKGF